MINEERIKLMTKLAAFEQRESKDVFRTNSYLRSDYVALHVIYTLIFSSIAFFLTAIVVIALNYNNILGMIHNADIFRLAYIVIIAWVVTEFIFCIIAWLFYRRRYKLYREKILGYVADINALEQMK